MEPSCDEPMIRVAGGGWLYCNAPAGHDGKHTFTTLATIDQYPRPGEAFNAGTVGNWIHALARELVAANNDRGRTFDNSPNIEETIAIIQRHSAAPASPGIEQDSEKSGVEVLDEICHFINTRYTDAEMQKSLVRRAYAKGFQMGARAQQGRK